MAKAHAYKFVEYGVWSELMYISLPAFQALSVQENELKRGVEFRLYDAYSKFDG